MNWWCDMYRNGYRAFGDIVSPTEEDVVITGAEAGQPMVIGYAPDEDVIISSKGGHYSTGAAQLQEGFGEIVVPYEHPGIVVGHREDVVVNADEEGSSGWDMMQDQFADDTVRVMDLSWPVGHSPITQLVKTVPVGRTMFGDGPYASPSEIGGGDDGLGFAAARRLKRRIRGKRVRIGGPQVSYFRYPQVFKYGTGDTLYDPYGFGLFGIKFHFRLPKFIRKFQFGRFLGRTALPFAVGGVGGLLLRRKLPGLIGKVFHGGGGGEQPQAPPAPVPGPVTDAGGGAIPPDIRQAIQQAPVPSPVAAAAPAPTASQLVAAAADQAGGGQETAETTGPAGTDTGIMQAGLGGPDLGNLLPILLIGGGLLLAGKLLPGRKVSRRRNRRR